MKDKLKLIGDYLSEHIPGADVETSEKAGGVGFVLRQADLEWSVLFTHEFLDAVPADQLIQRLDELQLIEEMTRAEDLPLVVEPSGVRLLSNN